ncbi:alpha-2A adrenergic receptor-like [Dreissena polymorpha]|uniref:G-protein coupled receptors family 1 profile domain-containing protein n=1 Tax=Dreissena polymorpha TaxID=45954 RepID=A0A9D4FRD7_DREPO|nr:alpha-2A adrenergic receptor-like [Dreissena polymorpha]KAH3802816.1 hypothetical protein DPMN_156506 [Dreissena polymorpha]
MVDNEHSPMDSRISDNSYNNSSVLMESLDDLNSRYADAALPLTIIFGFFTFFGFFGNLLILVVFSFSREYRRNNFKVFVLTLAVIDLITCVTLLPAEMMKQINYFEFEHAVPCKLKCFFNVFGASSSCNALLVISVDRYRKVVQPFKKQLTPKLAVKLLFGVAIVFPLFLAIPSAIMCGINTTEMVNKFGTNTTIHMCETEERFEKSIWRNIYKLILLILLGGISLAYLIMYAFVMRAAAKQIKAISLQRTHGTWAIPLTPGNNEPNNIESEQFPRDIFREEPPSKREFGNGFYTRRFNGNNCVQTFNFSSNKRTTPMLQRHGFPTKTIIWFILTIVYIVTYLTHNILSFGVSKIVTTTPGLFVTFSFFYRIYFINHIINPLVYAIFLKSFRTSCKNICPVLKSKLIRPVL